jgi:hypothetical protein
MKPNYDELTDLYIKLEDLSSYFGINTKSVLNELDEVLNELESEMKAEADKYEDVSNEET